MSTDIDAELRAIAEHLDRAMPPVSSAEVRLAAVHRPDRGPSGSARRYALVAATVLVLAVGVVSIVVARGGDDGTTPTPSATLAPPVVERAVVSVLPTETSVATERSGTTPSSTAPPTVTAAEATTSPAPDLTQAPTVAEVRAAQVEALRNLPGFSATVARTVTALDGTVAIEERTYSLLADGSFYSESGPGLFGSYDASTGVTLGSFMDPSGGLSYQQIVGQRDNSVPLLILTAYDPTQLVYEVTADADSSQQVEVIEYEGRPAWQVTTTQVFTMPPDFVSEGGPPPPDSTQITSQTVDSRTGLVVAYRVTSTNEQMQTTDARLTDVAAIDAMPDAFPGTFPPDADVAVSGDPGAFRATTAQEVADAFGVPTPVPATAGAAFITLTEQPSSYASSVGSPSEGAPVAPATGISRQATFTTHEGFVKTTVTVTVDTLDDGQEVPDGMVVEDGSVCFDRNGDGRCGPSDYTAGADTFTASAGALAGQVAAVHQGSIETRLSPFRISVQVEGIETGRAIVESFELLAPA